MSWQPLLRDYFEKSSDALARALIGCVLVHTTDEGEVAGRIVETEAYDQGDAASHSFRGPTPRNRVMFGPPGFAYVYFSYGVHWCMNVSAAREGHGAAVLLRALEPLTGEALMAKRRGLPLSDKSRLRLARGPGCLTQAMGINRAHDGADLVGGPLRIVQPEHGRGRPKVVATPRIGISKAQDVPWRFIDAQSGYLSGRR